MQLQAEITNLGKREKKKKSFEGLDVKKQIICKGLCSSLFSTHCPIVQAIDGQFFYLVWCHSHVNPVAHGVGKLHVVYFPI